MVTAYVGFGANQGDPIQQILDARRQLSLTSGVTNLTNSSLYLTSPVGYHEQSDFVNSVSSFETSLCAHSLLDAMQNIESKLGRQRDPDNRNAARLIDLDLLLYGASMISDERLTVPHPRLEQRLFTLIPLREIMPSLLLGNSETVSNVLNKGVEKGTFSNQKIYKLT